MSSCLLCLLLVCAAPAGAGDPPILRGLRFTGVEVVAESDLRGWMSTRPGERFSRQRTENDLRTLITRLRNEGFLGASAVLADLHFSADSSLVDITIEVAEGTRTLTGRITLQGNSILGSADLLDLFETKPGSPLVQTVLEQDFDAILHRYESLGFPFAECRVDSIHIVAGEECDSAFVMVSVKEGGRVSIEEIKVEGNRETNADVIVREARIKTGETFDPEKMLAVRERLQRLNIFTAVDEPELYLRGQTGGVLIRVREGSANTFDGVVGYVPASPGSSSGYVTGLVSVSMRNLFGTARKLRLRWLREDRLSQELSLGYSEPWVAGFPVNAIVEFDQRRQDTTYVRQALRLRSDLMVSEAISIGLVFSSETVIPSRDQATMFAPRSSTLMLGGDLVYDTRDDLYSPTSGARYQADYHYGRKTISPPMADSDPEKATVQRVGLNCDLFFLLFSRQVAALGIHARQVESDRLDDSELYRLGGAQSLRGFREGQFLGSRIAWTSAEYRLILGRRSFVFGFFDTGYYFRPSTGGGLVPSSEALQYGYGFGLRFDTPLGNMGVSFALGKGDSFANGKVHVGIINEF